MLAYSVSSSATRLRLSLEEYIEAVVIEAQDRERGHIRSISDYLALRRGSAGPKPSFYFYLLPVNISDDVLAHPTVTKMLEDAMDLICLGNVSIPYILPGHG